MSLRKERLSWMFIGIILAAVIATAYFVVWPRLQPHVTLRIGDGVFNARFISAEEYAKNGMPDTDQLRADKAVLHVYNSDGLWPIDMKQRHAFFDIVWLNGEKKVVHIVKNASADSVPATTFSPKQQARYMIELRGGTVDARAISIDDEAFFDEQDVQGLKL